MKTKRIIAIMTCMGMVLSMTACGGATSEKSKEKTNISSETTSSVEENVQISNPWTECSNIKEAEEKAGFSFVIPETIEGYEMTVIQNMDKELIEVIYEKSDAAEDASAEMDTIHLRKGTGTEDISGDCNEYSESNQLTVGSYQVTMQGNDGSVSLATWTDGGFTYAVSVPEMNAEDVITIIQQIQ